MGSEARPPRPFFVIQTEPGSAHDTSFERMGGTLGEAPRCPRCGTFIGMKPWLPPRRGIVELHGAAFGDLLIGPSGGFLASTRFVEAFRAEGLTGMPAFHPVEVVRVRGRSQADRASPPLYFYFTPTQSRAAVDDAQSHVRHARPITCDVCRQTGVDSIHGFKLEEASWSGEDVFVARGLPGTLIASERFGHFVERFGFTNIRLSATGDYTWDPLNSDPLRKQL